MRASTDAQWRSTMRSRIALNYRPVSESRFARRLMAVVATSDNIRAVREKAPRLLSAKNLICSCL